MSLETQIEGILFYKTEPIQKVMLADFFDIDASTLEHALDDLATRLQHGATRLVITDTTVQLVAASELAPLIERLKKDELSSSIGKAGAETLAIILYRGPITRGEIDRIRGVNSTFIIRNLLIRGLIERRENLRDARSFAYASTPELLNHLGITRREELPDFEQIMNTIDAFERNEQNAEVSTISQS